MSDEVYCYPPDFNVLKNKLGLREADELDYFEREFVYARAMQEMPTGDFDLDHFCEFTKFARGCTTNHWSIILTQVSELTS